MRVAVLFHQSEAEDATAFIEKNDLYDFLVSANATHALRHKMKKGAFAVIEGFNPQDHLVEIEALRKKYFYKIVCLDFETGTVDLGVKPDFWRFLKKSSIDQMINFKTWLDLRFFPAHKLLEQYENVYHIGDIQGCHAPLDKFLCDHFNDRGFYIFHGDYLDRGPENDKVFRRFYDDLMRRKNVRLLWGNHESDLARWANGRPLKIPDFREQTRVQLEHDGITPEIAYEFCRNLRDVFIHSHRGKKFVCTHGGLLDVPRRIVTIESNLVRGESTKDLKEAFEGRPLVMHHSFNRAAVGTPWVQVHGHTNAERRPICEFVATVLLNDYPEMGGNLRVWRLSRYGPCEGEPIEIRSILPPGFHYRPAA